MDRADAAGMIMRFIDKYRGKTVYFYQLEENEKESYVLAKSFNYFGRFLKTNTALTRAINNTMAHKKSNFQVFKENPMEHIYVA